MTQFIKVRGLSFRVLTWGAGANPILFLHGVHGTAESWDAVVQALNGALPAFAVDLRGHGESSWPEEGYDVRTVVKPTTKTISLRLPQHLLDSIKTAANSRDVPYQSLIKVWLQEKVRT